MRRGSSRSTLSMQLGQETIYLIMTIAVATALLLAMLVTQYTRPEKDPPIIIMRETEGFTFGTGSAALTPAFVRKLHSEIVPKLREAAWRSRTTILEVIGHTDEVPVRRSHRLGANLDYTLSGFLNGSSSRQPVAADNSGLGMARAVAVARVLREEGLGRQFQIFPMSAGPFQKTDDSAASFGKAVDDSSRRRIEIRMRRKKG